MDSARILVVDDDPRLCQLLDKYLTQLGFTIRTVGNAAQMDRVLEREHFDLLVLDIMLPGEDGLSVVRRMRQSRQELAIVMLTARGDEIDRVIGLELGADDYLPKPFNPRELVARIRSVLRRRSEPPAAAPSAVSAPVAFGPFRLDLTTRELVREGAGPLQITSGEFALLKVLVTHPRQPLSRERLLMLTRGREYDAFDRSVDVHISRIRRLIEEDVKNPRYIQTVWGLGYVFVPDGRQDP